MKRFFDSRYGLAFWFALMGLLFPLFLALMFCWLPGANFWFTAKYMFILFAAPSLVSALLLVLTRIDVDLSYGFGNGLYYGTAGLAYLTTKLPWYMPDLDRILLCFVIAALVCYIVWQNMIFKR